MYYLLFAFPLLIYFELLGRLFFYYIKKEKIEFNFIIGFCLIIAFLYVVGWPISIYGLASIYYVTLVCLFITISLVLIIKNIKKIDLSFNIKLWVVLIIFLVIAITISYNRTLGEEHGFDALFYINFIGYNVDTPALNNVHPLFGSIPNSYYEKTITYAFQSYNYFVSSFIFLMKQIGNIFKTRVETLPVYVWTFQIIQSSFTIGSSIEVIKHIKSKNTLFNIAAFILLVLFMGNFYYNNAYGFIGCNYRMPIHSIATIYLIDYLKDKNKNDLLMFVFLMLSMCGFSSTGTFAFVFILFALFFVIVNEEKNIIKYICISLFFPVLNILFIKLNTSLLTIICTIISFSIIFLLNDNLVNLFSNKRIKIFTVILISISLVFISQFIYSKSTTPLHYFFKNYSEYQDMSWDYFDFFDIRHWIFNLIVLLPMLFYIIKNHNDKFAMIIMILLLSVFNPFSANFINSINWVYYRTYDLILNQYTIIFFLNFLINTRKNKAIYSSCFLIISIILGTIQIPRIYHPTFKPNDNYNHIFKIQNDELELIWNLQKLVKEQDIKNPRIINPTFYINTFIDNSVCLIGKEKIFNYNDTNPNDKELYAIEYPEGEYLNFKPEKVDYDNLVKYINCTDYNILVVDYEKYFTYKGKYDSFSAILEKEGFIKSDYSTLKYAVFILN